MSLSVDEITDLIDRMEKETKAVRENILELCWYMRGALSFDEGMQLSPSDRDAIHNIIKEHLETTKKSGLPFF